MKAIALLVCSFLLLTACSSSSSSSKAECFTGAFNVVFAAEANANAQCPDLTANPTQWTYIASGDGKLVGPEPKGTKPVTLTADENTCTLSTEFDSTTPATGCGTITDSYFFQLSFDAKGLSGTYRVIGCVASDPDAGAGTPAIEAFDCTYPVTGTKVQ